MDIQTFVFLDTETTGLPFGEGNRTKITEMCIVAVQADHIVSGVRPPRVLNKLNLCFNPLKPIAPICKDLTGLSNELLQRQPEFQKSTVKIIKSFLTLQRKPLCLVAHNGNNFDYPILRAEIYNAGGALPDDIVCIDSLHAFRQLVPASSTEERDVPRVQVPLEFCDGFDDLLFKIAEEAEASECRLNRAQRANETTPSKRVASHLSKATSATGIDDVYYVPDPTEKNSESRKCEGNSSSNAGKSSSISSHVQSRFRRQSFKLTDVYARLTNKEPTMSHEAEYDCSMLIECSVKIGERFIDWANVNARKFSDIPMMEPSRKFGR